MTVTILGNNSALPAYGRHPTCQAVTANSEVLLLDCGEGAQVQMQRYGVKWRRLHHIFISHLHGDHYFGLPGLLNSMSLGSRTEPLHLYGPAALKPILDSIMAVAESEFSYPFFFHALPAGDEVLVNNESFRVTCFPVMHRIDCHGFVIEEKNKGRRILPDKCEEYGVPKTFFRGLKSGYDYVAPDGRLVANNLVTSDGPATKRYAYCADTLYTESFLPFVTGVDLMYHECTYLQADSDKAKARFHSTAAEAAQLAAKAGVGKLLLGHFSSRYKDLAPFAEEAGAIFPNCEVSAEGVSYEI